MAKGEIKVDLNMDTVKHLMEPRLVLCMKTSCRFNNTHYKGEYSCRLREMRIDRAGACMDYETIPAGFVHKYWEEPQGDTDMKNSSSSSGD